MKYKAFISYSHRADDVLAPALQSALHAFARPWSSMRALHVFRDQTSLAASPELWPAIENALNDSEFLLLMASPAAAASHWVGREIDWWFANRPKGSMFILLTEGELVWDETASDFDWERTTSVPRAQLSGRLRGEPLWVDLRWAKGDHMLSLRNTRFRSAILDIAAPLHGKDKDALDGDDVRLHARRQRVQRAVAVGLATLGIATTIAATLAVRGRREAERQGQVAQASRLAVQADLQREAGGAADESVMLASEALSLMQPLGLRSLETDLSMRRALALLPVSLNGILRFGDGVGLNAGGTMMLLRTSGRRVEPFRMPGAEPLGCDENAIDSITTRALGRREQHLIRSISEYGDWCVLQRFDSGTVNTLQLWRASPLEKVAQVVVRSQAGHVEPFVSANGDLLASNDRPQMTDESKNVLRIWSRRRNAEIVRRAAVTFVAFSPDSVHFATSDGLYRLSAEDRVPVRLMAWPDDSETPGFSSGLVFSRSGRYVATRREFDANVKVWQVGDATQAFTTAAPIGNLLAVRDDGRMIVVSRGITSLVSTQDDVVQATIPQEAKAAAFRGNDPLLLVGDTISPVYGTRVLQMLAFGDAASGAELPTGEAVHHIAFDRRGVLALSVSSSVLHLRAWNGDSTRWRDLYTADAPRAIAVSADGRVFAASMGKELRVVRLDQSASARVITTADTARVIGISRDGRHVAAWYGDSVHVWAGDALRPTSIPLARTPEALHVSSDAEFLVAEEIDRAKSSRAGAMHTLHRWRLTDPHDSISLEIGRALRDVASLCMVSSDARELVVDGTRRPFVSDTVRLQFTERDLIECDAGGAPVRLELSGARVLVLDRATAQPLARLDHARSVTQAAVSPDGKRLVAVDEAGEVRLHLLDAAELVAQACKRKPRPTARARSVSAAVSVKPHDACGLAWPQQTPP